MYVLLLNVAHRQHSSFCPADIPDAYSHLLFARDRCLSLALDEILRDVILADASDYGIDLAISRIFMSYRPGARRWEPLQYPNDRWLACETEAMMDQPFQTLHVNLLNGELRVAGQPLGSFPDRIKDSAEFRPIFHDVCICYTF